MVNRGASKGCLTCRQRRVKCDQTKPYCQHCRRLGRECAGYGRRSPPVRFKDETCRYYGSTGPKRTDTATSGDKAALTTTPSPPVYVILPSPSPVQHDLAIAFFLTYVTDLGRSPQSSRGFLEIVRPVLATEPHNSALTTAVTALATKVWTHLAAPATPAAGASSQPTDDDMLLNRALTQLQRAIVDPAQRRRDATVLAALVLQLHDTFSAVFGHRRVPATHHDGASALLTCRVGEKSTVEDGADDCVSIPSQFHGGLLAHILHAKVSRCVRDRTPFPASDMEWLETRALPSMPSNPSSLLDIIGISVANLQYDYNERPKRKETDDAPGQGRQGRQGTEEYWSGRIRSVDDQLRMWLEAVPYDWHPTRVECGRDVDASVLAYQGTCDIYPNIQVASLWNVWRVYRLVLVQIKIQLCTSHSPVPIPVPMPPEAQPLVDAICRSVPFYLGDRVDPTTLSDMENPHAVLPSYHDLQHSSSSSSHRSSFQRYRDSDLYLSRADHARHAVLQGPWRIMTILAHLVGLLAQPISNSGCAKASEVSRLATCLRPGQVDWIGWQFLRTLHLQRLVVPQQRQGGQQQQQQAPDTVFHALEAPGRIPPIEDLAHRIRQGLRIMSIV